MIIALSEMTYPAESDRRGLGPGTLYVQCDVADEAQVARAMGEVRERLGPVNVLVNNAGVGAGPTRPS
jgi:NAD(P)-dependent dehydrogenase (short-subunit alcohol dehydrogenase family)